MINVITFNHYGLIQFSLQKMVDDTLKKIISRRMLAM